jgi:membrane associated rhomboid family serine protease
MLIPVKDENPTRRFPWVTLLLIAINIIVYYLQMRSGIKVGNHIIERYALYPKVIKESVLHGEPLTFTTIESMLTHMFMHGGWLHLGGNMLFLWIFGNNVEDVLGKLRYLVFYLGSGFVAALTHIALYSSSNIPIIGASGAVAGVLGGYMLLYPHAKVVTALVIPIPFIWGLIRFVRIPAMLLLGLWFLLQFFSGIVSPLQPTAGMQVAYFAHVGGFIAGMLLIGIMK